MFLGRALKRTAIGGGGQDGSNQMFPVAWEIVEKENNESWTWFMET